MRRILIIGIGPGDPDQISIQAIKAMRSADAFFVIDKGIEKIDLLQARHDIFTRHLQDLPVRIVEIEEVERDRNPTGYREAVDAWHEARRQTFESHISDNLQSHECGAFLVWGDPSLYDSTIRILDQIVAAGSLQLTYEVIPGISSIQALAAKHKTTLNRIGQSIEITTGRKMAEGFADNMDSVVVMLDAENTYKRFADQDIDIYWGAYVGTPDEILVSGKLKDVADDIERIRADARRANGWIMDSYLMRRGGDAKI